MPEQVWRFAAHVSEAFPFAHAVELFATSLYESDRWGTLGEEAAWLAGLGLAYGALGRGREAPVLKAGS